MTEAVQPMLDMEAVINFEVSEEKPSELPANNGKKQKEKPKRRPRASKTEDSESFLRPKQVRKKPVMKLVPSTNNEFAPFTYEEAHFLAGEIDKFMGTQIDFEILSTIRYEPTLTAVSDPSQIVCPENFFLLKSHWQRLHLAIDFFKWDVEVPYELLVNELMKAINQLDPMLPYKLRVLVTKNNVLRVEAHPTTPRIDLFSGVNNYPNLQPLDPVYKVYLDTQHTSISPFTSFKTTYRDHYTKSRQRILKNNGDLEEVLVYNTCNEIMEGSISNVAFRRDDKWITPSLVSGCLCGVVRNTLLLAGIIEEGKILRNSVKVGDEVVIFNGIMGVCYGRIAE
ncbi:aminodeoxychorismate lyase ABZ2 [Sugiyamaella lignohabitans]|uniref:Aminodeoxychorismate lyase ABZ2 n=1 Tax=Sugiyamaella lignohabitans TaxID=796027 RepID=A0A161HN76_9ASCO|nr:aminodeoxychorismate lyase ABZ2 [Sugiyamaella lignohabitans]ANB15527.1 aminodeoxychorismate lyase ABZ2 [Sugiyamaella lignohabitans]